MGRSAKRAAGLLGATMAVAAPVAAVTTVAEAPPADAGYCSPPPWRSNNTINAEVHCTGGSGRGYIQARQSGGDWKTLTEGGGRNPLKLSAACLSGRWEYRTYVVTAEGSGAFKGGSDQYAPRFWTC